MQRCLTPLSPGLPRRAAPLAGAALLALAACLGTALATGPARAHGDVTPQAVHTKALPPLGAQWLAENP